MRTSAWMALVALCLAATLIAQRPSWGGFEPTVRNADYDGRFTFARVRYTPGPGGYYYRALPAWAHGYPDAEQNLVQILAATSLLRAHVEESNVLALDDPKLSRYPVAYMTEAGFWEL